MNPYWGKTFFSFLALFFERSFQLFFGTLSWKDLASDEIQVYVLTLVAIASALIGTFLILKKMTMLANALSHTILLGIIAAYLLLFMGRAHQLGINFEVMILGALIASVLTTLLTEFLHQVVRLQQDASIGLVFTTLFALGIVLVTLYTKNTHIGSEVIMGNVDALHLHDVKIAFFVTLSNAFIIILFFKEWKLISFDPALASSLGFSPKMFSYFLMFITSITAIAAFRAVGVLLFLTFLVGPPLTARLCTHNLSKVLIWACVIGFLSALFGVALSRHFLSVYHIPLSTAGLVVCLMGIIFLSVAFFRHCFHRLTLSKISG